MYFTEVTVEFEKVEIITSEVAGSVEVCVLVLSGILERDLVINLATMDGESLGMCCI